MDTYVLHIGLYLIIHAAMCQIPAFFYKKVSLRDKWGW